MVQFPKLADIVSVKEFQEIRDSVTFLDWTKTSDSKRKRPHAMNRVLRRPGDYDQTYLLALLRFKRTLKDPMAQQVVLRAAQEDNFDFFKKLARVLNKAPQDPYSKFQKLDRFLVRHWAEQRDGLPELCRLGAEGLTEVCKKRLTNGLTRDAVQKTRQRLGLVPCKRKKLHVKTAGSQLRFWM